MIETSNLVSYVAVKNEVTVLTSSGHIARHELLSFSCVPGSLGYLAYTF